jgi:hypothetical protein
MRSTLLETRSTAGVGKFRARNGAFADGLLTENFRISTEQPGHAKATTQFLRTLSALESQRGRSDLFAG